MRKIQAGRQTLINRPLLDSGTEGFDGQAGGGEEKCMPCPFSGDKRLDRNHSCLPARLHTCHDIPAKALSRQEIAVHKDTAGQREWQAGGSKGVLHAKV